MAIGTDGVVYARLQDVCDDSEVGGLVARLESKLGAVFVGVVVPGLTPKALLRRLDNAAAEAAASAVGQRRRRTARRT